jgi:uncharacterized protein YjbI with pentapeptide repeats
MTLAVSLIYTLMDFLTGVFEIAKESIFHPLSGSQLIETPSGYVAIRPGADLSHRRFENCDLSGVNFQNVNLDGAVFIDCDLKGADFTGAKITLDTKFERTPIENATGISKSKAEAA